jgi:hypothetical protein
LLSDSILTQDINDSSDSDRESGYGSDRESVWGDSANDSEWIPPCDRVSDSVDTDSDSVVFPALHDVCEDVTKVQELLKSRLFQ